MSLRVWCCVTAGMLLMATALIYGHAATHRSPRQRSLHSMAAVRLPQRPVAVTAEGKLFHDPSCRYIHGKAEIMSAQEAARRGYTPCPRCLRQALQH